MVLILIISAVKVTLRFILSQTFHPVLGPTWGLWAKFVSYGTCLGSPSLIECGL
jgi:hypothetical protein